MKNQYIFIWLAIIIVLITGLFFPYLQGVDATEYASIATHMYYRNDWVNIINHHPVTGGVYDYLDKPHLLFWSAMIGYKIFGVGAFGYRIISVLLSLAGAYATYRLGRLLYNEKTGKISAIFFITAQAIILADHDVKTDTLLTAFVALAVWHFAEFVNKHKLMNMIWGAAFLAGGVGTKGMIAALVAGCLVFFYILGRRDVKSLFNWKWLAGIAAFFVFLSPVLYCYYLQFDLHPEKLVNGSYGSSGIKFLLWSQSFERFAGDRNFLFHPEFSFFFHTFLWAFIPWSLIAYYGAYYRIKELVKTKGTSFFTQEQLTFTGVWVMFFIMSLSKFKLPHYINILFPFFAVFTAGFIVQLWEERKENILRVFTKIQWGIVFLAIIALLVINLWSFPINQWWIYAVALAGIIYIFILLRKKYDAVTMVWFPSAVAILLLNFVLNTNFYPKLDQYQAGSSVALQMQEAGIDAKRVYNYDMISHQFDFYSMHWMPVLTDQEIAAKRQRGEEVLLFADTYRKSKLDKLFKTEVLISVPDFGIALLTGKFMNPATRKSTYNDAFLLRIK